MRRRGTSITCWSPGQGLIFDKANLHGGTADQLRALLEEKTGHKALWVGKKP